VPIHTETSLFLDVFPGVVLAITGSKGKSSTSYFLHHLLGGEDNDVRLVGNMGGPSLDALAGATERTVAVLELSSFQIETIGERGLSTSVACLTNLQDDHLDRYRVRERYWWAKQPLFGNQSPSQWRVHPNEGVPDWFLARTRSRWCCVGADEPGAEAAVWLDDGSIWCRVEGRTEEVVSRGDVPVNEAHRLENVLVAIAAARLHGRSLDDLSAGCRDLPIVPNRMEQIPVPSSARVWINDTAASTPTAAAAGLRSRADAGSVTLICGGSSKDLDMSILEDTIVETAAEVVLLPGEVSHALRERLFDRGRSCAPPSASMVEAVGRAAATFTDIVLLSPGTASFARNGHPGFLDEFDRGGQFVAAVLEHHGVAVGEGLRAEFGSPRRRSVADALVWLTDSAT
jgi:UDP-N-acetylmuramoylalanine--D-glutamate ligase